MAGVQFNPVNSKFGGGGGAPAVPTTGLQVIGGGPQQQGGQSGASWYSETGMTMSGVMPEFLNEIFAPVMEAKKKEREWQGFSDAVSGVTVEEIRKDAPWYTKIFGPNHYESGVMMYEMQTKQTDTQAEFMARMPELRTLPGEQVSKILFDKMGEMMTGDPFMDSLVQKSSMEAFGPLMQQHTKERVAWQNIEMQKIQVDTGNSAFRAYQQIAKAGAELGNGMPMDPAAAEQLTMARNSLRDRMIVGVNQTDESAKQFVGTVLRTAVREGNFYPVEAMIEDGLLDAMSPTDAEQFQRQYDTGRAAYKSRFFEGDPAFGELITDLQTLKSFAIGGYRVADKVDEINRQWTAKTGSKSPWYDTEQRAQLVAEGATSWLNKYLREEDRAARRSDALDLKAQDAAAKEEAEVRNTARLTNAFQGGALGQLINLKGVEKGDADRASLAYFNQRMQENPQQATGFLIWNQNNIGGSYVNDMLSKQLQDNMHNAITDTVPAGDAFMAQYGMWREMFYGKGRTVRNGEVVEGDTSQGRATAYSYYGEVMTNKLLEFDKKIGMQMSPAQAYETTFGRSADGERTDFRVNNLAETKSRMAAFGSALDKLDAGTWDRVFGNGYKLHPSARANLERDMGKNYAMLDGSGYGTGNEAQQAIDAMNMSLGKTAEVVGGYYLTNARNQQPLSAYLSDTGDKERTAVLFNETITAKLKEVGVTNAYDHPIFTYRLADEGGVPVFAVNVGGADGYKMVRMTGTDMLDGEEAKLKAASAVKRAQSDRAAANAREAVQRTTSGVPLGVKVHETNPDAYSGMSRKDFDERGKRNRAKLVRGAAFVASPLTTLLTNALEDNKE